MTRLIETPGGFAISADQKTTDAIVKFVENEKRFLANKKSWRTRLAYLWGGLPGFSVVPFIGVWNSARLNGVIIKSIDKTGANYLIVFGPRADFEAL
jgi:hypothetical protein